MFLFSPALRSDKEEEEIVHLQEPGALGEARGWASSSPVGPSRRTQEKK